MPRGRGPTGTPRSGPAWIRPHRDADQLRVLAVAAPDVADPGSKWSGFYESLSRHVAIVGFEQARLPRLTYAALLARHLIPNRAAWWRLRTSTEGVLRSQARAWEARADTAGAFRARTRALESRLGRWSGRYELIVQLQTLFQPGRAAAARRFVVYTDWTHALQVRHRAGPPPTSRRDDAKRLELEAETARLAEHVLTFSEIARRSFIEDYGASPERVTAIGAGARIYDREPHTVAGTPPRALFVGYDFDGKGGPALLDCWPRVRAAVPDAELWIVGPPARHPAQEGVRWRGRVDSREQLVEIYRAATVFVHPPRLEAWGLVLHEAMGHGLPCIGVDAFAIPEIIDDGVTGLLVAPGDGDAIARALVDLLGNRERAHAMGEVARQRVVAQHTWDRVADRAVRAMLSPPIDRPRGAG